MIIPFIKNLDRESGFLQPEFNEILENIRPSDYTCYMVACRKSPSRPVPVSGGYGVKVLMHGRRGTLEEEMEGRETTVILVGGTDPSGGAGLPADIKTAAAMGIHGFPVVSALTVQDSGSVSSWTAVEPEFLEEQLRSVLDDGPVSGMKSGMLGSRANAGVLADILRRELDGLPYVLDPVLSSGSGDRLLHDGSPLMVYGDLLPLCTLVTPNLHEAEILTGIDSLIDPDSMAEAGRKLLEMGAGAALVKGGHLAGEPADVLVTRGSVTTYRGHRITGQNVHGTGCTLASACASLLAAGCPLEEAVAGARIFVEHAISRRMARVHGNLPGHVPHAAPPPPSPDGSAFYLPPVFCTRCGRAMTREPGEVGHLHCTNCGLVHYRNPLPAVAMVACDEGRILLVRRGVAPGKGELCLPGGFMESGESPEECGRRELLEETGLLAGRTGIRSLETDSTAYGSILLVVLEVGSLSGTPTPGDDASEVVWHELGNVPPLAFKAHDRIVRGLMEELTGR